MSEIFNIILDYPSEKTGVNLWSGVLTHSHSK